MQKLIFFLLTLCLLVILTTSYLLFYMPGHVHYEALAPLSEQELEIRENLKKHVIYLSDTIGERHYQVADSLEQSANYIIGQFEALAYDVQVQHYPAIGQDFINIHVEIKGTQTSEDIIVIGAHYDTVLLTPGADDNASGVAALIEIAALLKNKQPEKTLHLVAFSAEESPFYGTELMGSKRYLDSLSDNLNVTGMISLEMLGYYSGESGSQHYPWPINWFYPDTASFVAFVGNLKSRTWLHKAIYEFRASNAFPSEGLSAPLNWVPDVGRSDQITFWQQDIPAFMVTDTANFRNPDYHFAGDVYQTLDFDNMSRVVSGLAEMLITLATEE